MLARSRTWSLHEWAVPCTEPDNMHFRMHEGFDALEHPATVNASIEASEEYSDVGAVSIALAETLCPGVTNAIDQGALHTSRS